MATSEPMAASRNCPKCRGQVDDFDQFCPACGAPLASGDAAVADEDVYPQLAQANLARVRGEYERAKEILMDILRAHPNNVSAHVLLGDACTDAEEFDEAVQWYEIAKDLGGSSPRLDKGLEEAKSLVEAKHRADTAEMIGVSSGPNRIGLYAGLSILFVAVVGVSAYFIREKLAASNPARPAVISVPIEVPERLASKDATRPDESSTAGTAGATSGDSPSGPATTSRTAEGETGGDTSVTNAPSGTAANDALVLLERASKVPEGRRVTEVTFNPETKRLYVRWTLDSNETRRVIAAELGIALLKAFAEAEVIVLKGIRDGEVAYQAETHRSRYVELLGSNAELPKGDQPNVLSNETSSDEKPIERPGGNGSPPNPGTTSG